METLGLNEAAAMLNVSAETLREMASNGTVYGAKIGVSWVFMRSDILDYLRDEIRRQTSERRARAEVTAEIPNKQSRVSTGVTAAGARRRTPPKLDHLEGAI